MKEKLKLIAAALLFLLLLPYMITSFFSGNIRKDYAVLTASKDFISINTDGKIREISFKDYLCGVVATQISAEYPLEALKAQMVITRTNLKKQLEDLPGVLLSENYMTLSEMERRGIMDVMIRAEEETSGQVLTRKKQLVHLPYHAISGGQTRSGKEVLGKTYSWLKAVDSYGDVEAERYLTVEMRKPEELKLKIETEYPGQIKEGELISQLTIMKRDSSDYVTEIKVGTDKIPGEQFRRILGLSSSCFYLEQVDKEIRITTKGLGHGIGLSQFGAGKMAEAGADYIEILRYYFEKCIIG